MEICQCGKREKNRRGAAFNVLECQECRADFIALKPEFSSFDDAKWKAHLDMQVAKWEALHSIPITGKIQ